MKWVSVESLRPEFFETDFFEEIFATHGARETYETKIIL